MSNDDEQLLKRYAWLTEEDLAYLARHPAVAAFIEPDDEDLSPAFRRYVTSARAAEAELRARGEKAHERMVTKSGLQTTALVGEREER